MIRFSRPVLSGDAEARLRELLVRGPGRATGARILNDQSRRMLQIAQDFTRNEIHDRPDDRRSRESLAHGKTYYESWDIVPAKERGYELVAAVRNDHPFARAVENGTPPHEIAAKSPERPLAFPFVPGQSGGGVNQLGNFPVAWSDAETRFSEKVQHPGAAAHRIARRSRDKFRKESKRILNRG